MDLELALESAGMTQAQFYYTLVVGIGIPFITAVVVKPYLNGYAKGVVSVALAAIAQSFTHLFESGQAWDLESWIGATVVTAVITVGAQWQVLGGVTGKVEEKTPGFIGPAGYEGE